MVRRITELNRLLASAAARQHCTHIDLWPVMADSNGALRKKWTRDNLHINPKTDGHHAWAEVLYPHLQSDPPAAAQ